MKKNIQIILMMFAILFTGCNRNSNADSGNSTPDNTNTNSNNNSYNQPQTKTPQELKAELLTQELNKPLDYLEVDNGTLEPQTKKVKNGGLFNGYKYYPDGAIVEGNITNKATIARFKDVVVKISYYTQTNTFLDEKSYVIYEYQEPHRTKHFSIRVDVLPESYQNFNMQITDAKPAD